MPQSHEIIAGRFVLRALYQKPSGRWAARIRDTKTGRVREATATEDTERKARQQLREWLERLAAEEGPDIRPIPLREALDHWLELRDVRPPTRKHYAYQVEKLKGQFGDRLTTELEFGHVEDYVAELRKAEYSPRTIAMAVQTLRQVYRWAIRRRFASENPTDGIRLSHARRNAGRALTIEEARQLLHSTATSGRHRKDTPLYLALALSLYTGLRRRNVLELRWRQVELDRGRLLFGPEDMKGKRRHELPIHPSLARLLARERLRRSALDPESLVLGRRLKELFTPFRLALEVAGLPPMRWHDLRHTFATWMATRAPQAVHRELLAHSAGSVTDFYVHVGWEDKVEAIAALPDLLRSLPEKKPQTAP